MIFKSLHHSHCPYNFYVIGVGSILLSIFTVLFLNMHFLILHTPTAVVLL